MLNGILTAFNNVRAIGNASSTQICAVTGAAIVVGTVASTIMSYVSPVTTAGGTIGGGIALASLCVKAAPAAASSASMYACGAFGAFAGYTYASNIANVVVTSTSALGAGYFTSKMVR